MAITSFGNVNTLVEGTIYRLEYEMTQDCVPYEDLGCREYGMKCTLYGSRNEVLETDNITCITPNLKQLHKTFQAIVQNHIFPSYIREVLMEALDEYVIA